MPDFFHERRLIAEGHVRIAGVDEVGRGPLAGPVMAAAVVLDPACIPEGLDDSKKLGLVRGEALAAALMGCAEVSVAAASVAEIDGMNILRASHLAMLRAIAALDPAPDAVLIDGHLLPAGLALPARAITGGDGVSLSIAAASIVAKIRRDDVMRDLAQHCPGYGWETNMGYPTKSHRSALENLGVSPHHRRSFRPVYQML